MPRTLLPFKCSSIEAGFTIQLALFPPFWVFFSCSSCFANLTCPRYMCFCTVIDIGYMWKRKKRGTLIEDDHFARLQAQVVWMRRTFVPHSNLAVWYLSSTLAHCFLSTNENHRYLRYDPWLRPSTTCLISTYGWSISISPFLVLVCCRLTMCGLYYSSR